MERNSKLAALALALAFVGVGLMMFMASLKQKPVSDDYQWQPQDHWLSPIENAELQQQIDYLQQCRQLSAAEGLNFLDLFRKSALVSFPEKRAVSGEFSVPLYAYPELVRCLTAYAKWGVWVLGCEKYPPP